MKKSLVMLLAFAVFNASAMSENECKSQALVAKELLQMATSGVMPANEKKVEFLREVVALVDKGQFCAARTMLLKPVDPVVK